MIGMVERVARALRKADGEKPSVCAGVCTYSSDWRDYVDDAVTAIAAMREPTEGMEFAGIREGCLLPVDGRVTRTFTAMIDAALEEKP